MADDLFTAVLNLGTQKASAKKEYQRQKEFAQNQIQWRVKDAQAAGIHPLYALGAQGVSYAPQSASGLDLGFGDMGANMQRAMLANRDRRDQMELQTWERKRAAAADAMAVRKHEAELGLIASEIELNRSMAARNANSAQLGPGVPRTNARPGAVEYLPSVATVGSAGNPGAESGIIPEIAYSRGTDGGLRPVMSRDYKQRAEDDIFQQLNWHSRYTLLPGLDVYTPPNPTELGYPARDGYEWRWSWWSQAWFEERRR